MRRTVLVLLLIAVVALLIVPISAHPGGTDSNGGHYDHSSGDYHYHHGYPAHDHSGGKCPYDFASGSSSSGGSSSGGGCADSSGGNWWLLAVAAIVLILFIRFWVRSSPLPPPSKSDPDIIIDAPKYRQQPAPDLTPPKQSQPFQSIQESDYSWDDAWNDYVETDTEGSKTEYSIEDLYDFYDNLPEV